MKRIIKYLLYIFTVALILCAVCVPIYADNSDVPEVTLTVAPSGGEPVVSTGTWNNKLAELANIKPTVPTTYTLVLNRDATYSAWRSINANENVTLNIDLNGYTLTVSGVHNNLFQITGNFDFNLDGADENGNRGKIVCHDRAGAIVYTRANNGLNENTVVNISDVEMYYTDMSSGYSDSNRYPNQPMCNVPAGTVNLTNVKMTYTGENATALEGTAGGSDITAMRMRFIQCSNAVMTLKNCEFLDTNTKGIKTYGLDASGTANITVVDSKLSGFYGIVCSGNSSVVTVRNSLVTGTFATYDGAGKIDVYDSDSYVPGGRLVGGSIGTLTFYYGTGNNNIHSDFVPSGKYTVESGYELCLKAQGVFVVDDPQGYTTVTMPVVFSDNMVFQRRKNISVYGYCETEGAQIKVTLGDVSKTVTVNGGKWEAVFEPMEAAKNLTLTVEELGLEHSFPFVYNNVDIGEIWVISGQSNAEYETYKLEDAEEYLANADNFDNIRAFCVPSSYGMYEDRYGVGSWYQVKKETLMENSVTDGDISGIAYVMATKLAVELSDDVTIAIMDITYSGSTVKAWIDYDVAVEKFGSDSEDINNYNAYKEFYDENGKYPASGDSVYIGSSYKAVMSVCYNKMIYALNGFSVRGVVWYHGESDIAMGENYITYYQAVTETFRNTFADDTLPFFVIQLHPYGGGDNLKDFRYVQYEMVRQDQYSNLISSGTEGAVMNGSDLVYSNASDGFVHPSRKSPLGIRCADLALELIYGTDDGLVNIAPDVEKIEAAEDRATITFDSDVELLYGDKAEGFEVAGDDGVFVKAEAEVSGNTVILRSDEVVEIREVRYAYAFLIIETEDGTRIAYDKKLYNSSTNEQAVIIGPDKKEYIFYTDKPGILRSTIGGNITNSSGYPLPAFKLRVGYGTT